MFEAREMERGEREGKEMKGEVMKWEYAQEGKCVKQYIVGRGCNTRRGGRRGEERRNKPFKVVLYIKKIHLNLDHPSPMFKEEREREEWVRNMVIFAVELMYTSSPAEGTPVIFHIGLSKSHPF
jgi:hypothetical protein